MNDESFLSMVSLLVVGEQYEYRHDPQESFANTLFCLNIKLLVDVITCQLTIEYKE